MYRIHVAQSLHIRATYAQRESMYKQKFGEVSNIALLCSTNTRTKRKDLIDECAGSIHIDEPEYNTVRR